MWIMEGVGGVCNGNIMKLAQLPVQHVALILLATTESRSQVDGKTAKLGRLTIQGSTA